ARLTLKELSKEQRLKIAIDLCLELAYLHEGLKSSTGTGYAHLDLKPRNVTIDKNNAIHLIDHGMSESNPYEKRIVKKNNPSGTAMYLPYYAEHPDGLTKEQFDMIALKRLIFLQISFNCKSGKKVITEFYQKTHRILTQKILD